MKPARDSTVSVEIREETLARLFANGHVCAADFHCLDDSAKRSVWQMMLNSCRRTGLKPDD